MGQGAPKHLPKITENIPPKANKALPATALTWGGSLVDDLVSILLRDDGVTHSQQGKELLYAGGCGLKAEEPVNQLADL